MWGGFPCETVRVGYFGMSNQATTDFQERMAAAVEKLAVEIGANCECQLIRGKTENYYLLSLVS